MIVSSFRPAASVGSLRTLPKAPELPQAESAGDSLSLSATQSPVDATRLCQLGAAGTAQLATQGLGLAGPVVEQPLRMILIGPPGSGKGTQAHIINAFFHAPHISTGEILRSEVKQQTELGKEAEKYMKAGQLVPDSIMLQMVDQRLEKEDGFILDGFPRSIAQAEHLDQTLSRLNKPLTCAAALDVSDEIVFKRLKERGRQDDTDETIRARIQVYHEQTEPVMSHYQQQGLLEHIPAEGKVPEVGYNMVTRLNTRRLG